MNPNLADEFQRAFRTIVGLSCWRTVAGEGTGLLVRLDFGKILHRQFPIRTPHLSPAEQRLQGEVELRIGCTWRLDDADGVVSGGWDANEPGGPMLTGLARLKGAIVSAVTLQPPAYDFAVHFDHGLVLKGFCDKTDPEDENGLNYVLFREDLAYGVGPRGELLRRPR